MSTPAPRALIFMNGRNCERFVSAAIESLVWQTHPAVHVLFVDDCSTDATAEIARQMLADHFRGRHTLVRNPEPWGKARNAHVHLRAALAHGDFVAVLDADDQLIVASILADLSAQYAAGFDVVWTNFETDRGGIGNNGPLDPFRPPRGQGWKTSHFFSFRAELFEPIPEDYFQDETGQWLPAACDFAIAFPVLDQTRRYHHLPVRAYRYTVTNPASHHNQDPQAAGLNSRRQMRCAQVVLNKPALPCRRWLFGPHAAADHAVFQLHQRLAAENAALVQQMLALETARAAAPVATPADDAWAQQAVSVLHQCCPALLALAMDDPGPPPSPALLWRWWQWLQRGPAAPRVLEIGAGTLAPALHALVRGLGGRITTVCGDHDRALALYARLGHAGIDEPEVLHTPLIDAAFDDVEAQFPNLAALPDDASAFDLAIVSAAACGTVPRDALLALPMLVPRLNPQGFRLCLWSPEDAQPMRDAASLWRSAAPDLVFSENALAGAALVVQAA